MNKLRLPIFLASTLVFFCFSCADRPLTIPEYEPTPNEDQVAVTPLPGDYEWVKSTAGSATLLPSEAGYREELNISGTEFTLLRDDIINQSFPYVTLIDAENTSFPNYRLVNADGGRLQYTFYFTNEQRLFLQELGGERYLREYRRIN